MLFSEIYSAYYNATANLINKAIDGELSEKTANEIIKETAFSESFVYILDAIKNEQWQVITKGFKTPIKNKANMPLTLLQKQFLKTISLDKRFKLFCDGIEGLEDIEPLYYSEDLYYFDIIKDGDPYDSPVYIDIFKIVLKALKENKKIKISYESGKGYNNQNVLVPRKLEYSQKDDKFRLICLGRYGLTIINIARIKSCELLEEYDIKLIKQYNRKKSSVTLEIRDERNALERSMLHFANLEKVTKQVDENLYRMELKYYKDDETEVLIRILSFGPMVKVTKPESFIKLIKERLNNQKKLRQI